jgi:hypothetical protein
VETGLAGPLGLPDVNHSDADPRPDQPMLPRIRADGGVRAGASL